MHSAAYTYTIDALISIAPPPADRSSTAAVIALAFHLITPIHSLALFAAPDSLPGDGTRLAYTWH